MRTLNILELFGYFRASLLLLLLTFMKGLLSKSYWLVALVCFDCLHDLFFAQIITNSEWARDSSAHLELLHLDNNL